MQQLVQGHAAQIICPLGCPTLCKMGGGEEAAGQQKEEPGWGRWGPWITWRPARRERTPPHPHQQGLPKVRDSLCLSLPPCVSVSKCLLGGGAGAAGSGRQGREGCRSPHAHGHSHPSASSGASPAPYQARPGQQVLICPYPASSGLRAQGLRGRKPAPTAAGRGGGERAGRPGQARPFTFPWGTIQAEEAVTAAPTRRCSGGPLGWA